MNRESDNSSANEIGSRKNRVRVYNNNKKNNKKKSLTKYKFTFLFVPIISFFQILFSSNRSFEKEKLRKIESLDNEIKNIDININNMEDYNKKVEDIINKQEILLKIKNSKENLKIKTITNKNLDILDNYLIDLDNIKDKKGIKEVEEIEILVVEENPFKEKLQEINKKIEEVKNNFVSLEIKLKYEEEEKNKEALEQINIKIKELKQELEKIKEENDIEKLKNNFEILKLDVNKYLDGSILEEFDLIFAHQKEILDKRLEEKTLKESANIGIEKLFQDEENQEKIEKLNKKPKEKKSKSKKEDNKEENKPKKKRRTFKEINQDDIFLMDDYIKKDIEKVNKEVSKLNKILDNNERRGKSIPVFRTFLANTLRFGVTLLPASLFKNKLLGGLLSQVLLNNKIRSMRNIIKKQEINYIDLDNTLESIKKNSLITDRTITICDDSLYQLVSLKNDFVEEYELFLNNEEVIQTLNKIEVLENTLIKQKEKLTGIKQNYEQVKQKVNKMVQNKE